MKTNNTIKRRPVNLTPKVQNMYLSHLKSNIYKEKKKIQLNLLYYTIISSNDTYLI